MRPLAAWFALALAASLVAQPTPPAASRSSLFLTVKPQATVVVQEHNTGADFVDITLLDPHYPPDVLRGQIAELGRLLGSNPRGVRIYKAQILKDMNFVKASFAVDGLIDPEKGLRLAPIVKAMAGAPGKRALHGMSVIFERQAPKKSTISRFGSEAVEVEAQIDPQFAHIEYRVRLHTQDPARIDIPDGPPPPQIRPQPPVQRPSGGISVTLIALFAIAALAAGALVYSLLLRARPKERLPR